MIIKKRFEQAHLISCHFPRLVILHFNELQVLHVLCYRGKLALERLVDHRDRRLGIRNSVLNLARRLVRRDGYHNTTSSPNGPLSYSVLVFVGTQKRDALVG